MEREARQRARAEAEARSSKNDATSGGRKGQGSKKGNSKKKKKKDQSVPKESHHHPKKIDMALDQADDDWAILEQAAAATRECNVAGCKARNVTGLAGGFTCTHCRLRYCMRHSRPDAHGCGADDTRSKMVR